MSLKSNAKKIIIGGSRDPQDPHIFHKLSLIAFFAWVGLGSDGLSSSCYGPEEAFLALGGHFHLGILVALASVITIFVISTSYTQIIELFPFGGGGYLVASKLLSAKFGMISGCALLVDYVLTITLSIASGADAIFSFLPLSFQDYKLAFAVAGVVLLILLNLRGIKESVVPLVPIFLTFIFTHGFVILYALMTHLANYSEVVDTTITDIRHTSSELGFFGAAMLVLRAYSVGAGTFTGIEAVSNGLPILREPKVETAKRTMRYMAISLSLTVLGLMIGYILFRVEHVPGKTLNAVLLQQVTGGWNESLGYTFLLITLLSEAVLLFVASQTGFLDGPRVLANMAMDRWFPSRFAMLSDRLVTQNGILLMGGASIILMILSKGSVRFMVVLYSINVFITFSLSQLGMVRHWWQRRKKEENWPHKLAINGLGLFLTAFILISVSLLKFHEGGWITLLVTGSLVAVALTVKRHYQKTGRLLKRLDTLVEAAQVSIAQIDPGPKQQKKKFNPQARTAVLLVSGFNGLGLHTLFGAIRLFSGEIQNFVFVQVGVVDAGVFKGSEDVALLQKQVNGELDRYIKFMEAQGYCAEGQSAIGTDVVEEVSQIAPAILRKYPNAIFFGGQIVFPQEHMFYRWLHNYTVFAVQRRFYYQGIPVILLPIRVA